MPELSHHTLIRVARSRDGWTIECTGAYVHRGPLDAAPGARWPSVARAVVDYLGDSIAVAAHPAAWSVEADGSRTLRALWAGRGAP